MPPNYSSVPDTLKNLPNWVIRNPRKQPFNAKDHTPADTTNPDTWSSFGRVKDFASIGFVFDGNGLVGIDLDHCLDFDGDLIVPDFQIIIDKLKSFTEISPSGTGLHIIIETDENPELLNNKRNGVEMYYKSRYFTITGKRWKDSPDKIKKYPVDLVYEVLFRFLGIKEKPPTGTPGIPVLSDDQIISIAFSAKNNRKFHFLMNGDISGYGDDESRADFALAGLLAFYTSDVTQIERIMRTSRLNREKWDRHQTYLHDTITKAMAGISLRYEAPLGDVEHGKEMMENIMRKWRI